MTSVNGEVSKENVFLGKGDKDEFEIEVANPDIVRIDGFGSGGVPHHRFKGRKY